ncbi:DUF6325 family protein [Yinghuangia sp. ASG 101]|uniref:DUF6325 family protein n=1 Tax=Yinghuangia sp. ASG 101 TaxID=2896848 RepID=UPI001E4C2B9C|nr:DUF6325 family protein [Yinghuangia sp. ASG 101]UGQ09635.1 DUF6325 family protein [Yinghuangia sp. ASG 101]
MEVTGRALLEEAMDVGELGPVDAIVLGFPGRRLTRSVLEAVDEVEARGDVRVIDMLIVIKDVDGEITHHEISEYEDLRDMAAEVAARRMLGLAGESDVEQIGLIMPPDSLVMVVFVENIWAREVAVRIREAGGRLLSYTRLPQATLDDVEEHIESSATPGDPPNTGD